MAAVVFQWAEWQARYPAFIGASQAQAEGCFAGAELLLNNTATSLVSDDARRKTLLYLLAAHIAALTLGENGQIPSGLVGRVTSATQGSVSVSLAGYGEGGGTPGMEWYTQTQYGAMYWQATADLRTMHYFPGQRSNVFVPGFRGRWWQ